MTTLAELLRSRVDGAQTQLDLIEHELDELHDPQALEHASIAGFALTHLRDRLDELIADQREVRA